MSQAQAVSLKDANSIKTIYLKDYQVPAYLVESIELCFDLYEHEAKINAKIKFHRNTDHAGSNPPLVLYGKKIDLHSLKLDGNLLPASEYTIEQDTLTIPKVPAAFSLEIDNTIYPQDNTELSGLYRSGALFCTQCEPEGFRAITYYPDRPDVMSIFKTTIIANKKTHPVLLSNGNCIAKGEVKDQPDRHWLSWHDPFKKPSYLFALVAGDLIAIEDFFLTLSGRLVTLKLFIEHVNLAKAGYAMQALKKAMQWDEETYGREYDLDIYMIVAVNDFNMGAMENKGLNLFNAKYVLASPETATDTDYYLIDAVVGHEYFHNWSGNRITCRDWFQLSLKEGLTVFREHQFSQAITQSPVSLIENARLMRSRQFPEDASPMAHSVRPDSYVEINNFYTVTIYEKGAEVIRMMHTLLGAEAFRRGMDLYFAQNDGQAVTTEEFVSAMETASNQDLSQFRLWYTQAGTPMVGVSELYDPSTQSYTLTLTQTCEPTPNQPSKKPFHIPLSIGLLGEKGEELLPQPHTVIDLKQDTQSFEFKNIAVRPVLSILRAFSAPVKIRPFLSQIALAFLLAHDTDDFNRWDAAQQLSTQVLLSLIAQYQKGIILSLDLIPSSFMDAYRAVLLDTHLNTALKAEMLCFPSINELIEIMDVANVQAIYAARSFLQQALADILYEPLMALYQQHQTPGPYIYNAEQAAHRRLKNVCLSYLMKVKKPAEEQEVLKLTLEQFQHAKNMTDSIGALSAMVQKNCTQRAFVLQTFYDHWQHEPLVLNKWLSLQASAELTSTLEAVKALTEHPAFDFSNPNKVYALLGGFAHNAVCFHNPSGAGYTFIREMVLLLDPKNPQVAAHLMSPFMRWRKFDPHTQTLMLKELKHIQATPNLSKDLLEIINKLVPLTH
jgi:aminopeptidase N